MSSVQGRSGPTVPESPTMSVPCCPVLSSCLGHRSPTRGRPGGTARENRLLQRSGCDLDRSSESRLHRWPDRGSLLVVRGAHVPTAALLARGPVRATTGAGRPRLTRRLSLGARRIVDCEPMLSSLSVPNACGVASTGCLPCRELAYSAVSSVRPCRRRPHRRCGAGCRDWHRRRPTEGRQ